MWNDEEVRLPLYASLLFSPCMNYDNQAGAFKFTKTLLMELVPFALLSPHKSSRVTNTQRKAVEVSYNLCTSVYKTYNS